MADCSHLCMQEPDWRARESGILALGAISDGCANGLLPHLEGMIAMLLPKVITATLTMHHTCNDDVDLAWECSHCERSCS